MTDGIILIDKPAGITSFGVVARLRRVLNSQAKRKAIAGEQVKKIKVGHTGTLDPFATGLMILVVGKECKNAEHYTKLDKVYQATFCLGKISTTGDPEGEITQYSDRRPELDEVQQAIKAFTGEIMQRPPIFSAIKINGQRAYKLARDGKEIEMPARKVQIFKLEVVSYDYPNLTVQADVSSGTYIRSLAVDMGEFLGTGAYCSQLRRIRISKWSVEDAKTLADYGINS